MSNQDKLYEARDIIFNTLMAVPVRKFVGVGYELWAMDRARNAAQALMLLLCPEPSRGRVPQTESEWNDERIK